MRAKHLSSIKIDNNYFVVESNPNDGMHKYVYTVYKLVTAITEIKPYITYKKRLRYNKSTGIWIPDTSPNSFTTSSIPTSSGFIREISEEDAIYSNEEACQLANTLIAEENLDEIGVL